MMYLEGLSEDESVPFSWKKESSGPGEMTPGMTGPKVRENVDMGSRVFDLTAFRAELEAERAKKTEGGEPAV
jgi:hypothetical protein